jgi:hypothetical protein
MNVINFKAPGRLLIVMAALSAASCAFQGEPPASPLVGSWTTADRNRVTFRQDAVVLTPDAGRPTTMGPGECNGVYKLQYGRMSSAALQQSFPAQPDMQVKLRQLLTKPEYPVADVTCDRGGTTYLLLNDRDMLAVYRDAGVGGTETLSRL